jgi:hypothetical protein
MRKVALIGLVAGSLGFLCTAASAEPISSSDAHNKCSNWTNYMTTHSSVCAFCVVVLRNPVCHVYSCDQDGCDHTAVEKRAPKGKWTISPSRSVVRPQ